MSNKINRSPVAYCGLITEQNEADAHIVEFSGSK